MTETTRPDLRVGVLGLGIGQLHLNSWRKVEGAEVVAVADLDEQRRAQTEHDWGVPAVGSLDGLLALGIDVLDICTPPVLHEQHILRGIGAGVHVICEKPFVDSLDAFDRVRAAADAAHASSGQVVMPILQYRFGDGAARARALIDAGLTGRLYTASASTWWRRGPDYYGEAPWRGTWAGERGGCILTHAIHIHDLLTWMGGPLTELGGFIDTRVNDIETEDCAVAIGRTADGALMTMNVTLGAATESSRLTWHFEHVTVNSGTHPYAPGSEPWTFEFPDEAVQRAAEAVWAQLSPLPRQFTGQFQLFVDAVDAGTAAPITLDDARATLELVTGWYHSARTGSVAQLPLAADHPDRGSWRPEGIA